MEKKTAYKRRNYFIKKGLQSKFIFGFTLKVVLGFLASWLFVYYTVDKRLSEALYRSHITIGSTGEIIGDILLKVNLFAVPLLLLSAVGVGIYLVRHVTAPLWKFKEALEDFGRADLTQKTFFKDDFPELSKSYNTMIENYSTVLSSVKGKGDELEKLIEELDRIAGSNTISRQEVEEIYKSISENRSIIESEVSFFKI